MPPPEPHLGHVYLIRVIGTDIVKVGWSRRPVNRAHDLQTGCPFDLELTHTMPGTRRDEHTIQSVLGDYHMRGEWYDSFAAALVTMFFVAAGMGVDVCRVGYAP